MPPLLALCLCSGFVLWLLMLDQRWAPEATVASWLTTAWMLVISTKPLAIWFSSSAQGLEPDSGSPLDRAVLLLLLLLALIILCMRRFDTKRFLGENPSLAILVLFLLLSVVWSDIPLVSFKRWTRQFEAVVMGCLILTEPDPIKSAISLFRRTVFILIPFSLLLIKYYPAWGVEFGQYTGDLMWVGVTTQKNGLGRLCLLSAFFLIWSLSTAIAAGEPKHRLRVIVEIALLAMVAFLMKGPKNIYSATSLVTLGAGTVTMLLLLFRRNGFWLKTCSLLFLIFIAIGAVTPLVGGATVGAFTGVVGRDSSFTGRTEIWSWLLSNVSNSPIFGVGFGAFWTAKTIEVFQINEAHNGYLDVLLETGVFGLILHCVFLGSCWRAAYRSLSGNFGWSVFCFSLLIMTALYNTTESTVNILASQMTATLLIATIALCQSAKTWAHSEALPEGTADALASS